MPYRLCLLIVAKNKYRETFDGAGEGEGGFADVSCQSGLHMPTLHAEKSMGKSESRGRGSEGGVAAHSGSMACISWPYGRLLAWPGLCRGLYIVVQ